jgi:hypothetical protein
VLHIESRHFFFTQGNSFTRYLYVFLHSFAVIVSQSSLPHSHFIVSVIFFFVLYLVPCTAHTCVSVMIFHRKWARMTRCGQAGSPCEDPRFFTQSRQAFRRHLQLHITAWTSNMSSMAACGSAARGRGFGKEAPTGAPVVHDDNGKAEVLPAAPRAPGGGRVHCFWCRPCVTVSCRESVCWTRRLLDPLLPVLALRHHC